MIVLGRWSQVFKQPAVSEYWRQLDSGKIIHCPHFYDLDLHCLLVGYNNKTDNVTSLAVVSRCQDIVTATAALEEVKQSTKFAKILELILLFGNYMNAGSRNEQTLAFEFSFITKVRRLTSQMFPLLTWSCCRAGRNLWLIGTGFYGTDVLSFVSSDWLVWFSMVLQL